MSLKINPLQKGTTIARIVQALCLCKNFTIAADYAETHYRDTPAVALTLRALSEAGAQTSGNWAAALSQYGIGQELYELYRSQSVVGRLSDSMKPAPFKTNVPRETTSPSVNWVGESLAKPITVTAFSQITLDDYKIAAIVPITEALAMHSSPSAERVITRIILDTVTAFIDGEFLSNNAAVAGESPAGILNGQQTHVSSGATEANIRADVSSMCDLLTSWIYPVWVCRPGTFAHIASLGILDFLPGGPLLVGFPIMWSNASPAELLLIDMGACLLADDGQSSIDIAREATITMDDGTSPTVTTSVSLWQQNMVGIKVERFISWSLPGDHSAVRMAVAY